MSRWHSPPAELYAVVERTPATVLLESAKPADAESSSGQPPPPTRLFIHPLRICVANHLAEIPCLFAEIERAVASGLFAAGYFSYECGAFFEPTAALHCHHPGQAGPEPLAWFGIYQRPHLFDHRTGAFVEGDPPALAQFRSAEDSESLPAPELDCALTMTEQEYAQRIADIHALIRSGDVYQLNFTIPIQVRVTGNSAAHCAHCNPPRTARSCTRNRATASSPSLPNSFSASNLSQLRNHPCPILAMYFHRKGGKPQPKPAASPPAP
jgi:para-aminobenzoate synthetase/4-amino-4-deoxychorismate lyase